jgi:hypothetical protein
MARRVVASFLGSAARHGELPPNGLFEAGARR